MNKLIERLKAHAERGDSPIAYEAAWALEAADRVIYFGTRHKLRCKFVIGQDCDCGADEALTTYRNLTQEARDD